MDVANRLARIETALLILIERDLSGRPGPNSARDTRLLQTIALDIEQAKERGELNFIRSGGGALEARRV